MKGSLGHGTAPWFGLGRVSGACPWRGRFHCEINVADTALNPGRYTGALQVREGTSTELFWIGQILVSADPF